MQQGQQCALCRQSATATGIWAERLSRAVHQQSGEVAARTAPQVPDSLWHQELMSVHCHAGLFRREAQDVILGILLIFGLPGVVLVTCLALVARLVIKDGQAVYACKQCKDTGPKVSSTGSCPNSGDVTWVHAHPCVWGAGGDRLEGQALASNARAEFRGFPQGWTAREPAISNLESVCSARLQQ